MITPTWREGRYADIYSDEPKEPFASNRSKNNAMITAWFLVEKANFKLALDYGITVEENNKRFKYRSEWVLTISKEALKYKNDIEKMQTAISDFWYGYNAYKELNK